jgi:hypothetical protein
MAGQAPLKRHGLGSSPRGAAFQMQVSGPICQHDSCILGYCSAFCPRCGVSSDVMAAEYHTWNEHVCLVKQSDGSVVAYDERQIELFPDYEIYQKRF